MPEKSCTISGTLCLISSNKAIVSMFEQLSEAVKGLNIVYREDIPVSNSASLKEIKTSDIVIVESDEHPALDDCAKPFLILSRTPFSCESGTHPVLEIPVRLDRLLVKIKDMLNESNPQNIFYKNVICGDFELHPESMSLTSSQSGEAIRLTQTEYHLLFALFTSPEHWLSREDLLETIWGYNEDIQTRTLETHIYRLRQKIERDPAQPDILINENYGYRIKL